MKNINKNDVEFLIDCLKNGKEIPQEYKYALFPTKQKEYELIYSGKSRKEDVLADNEEAKAVPLQIEKIFNDTKHASIAKEWHNLLVFGDNLQILKTFYKNEDPLVKNKVRGKVKLICIDPPFATESDFKGSRGQKAYSDKAQGAEFVEFIRKRLIVARELLSEDGFIAVHLDQKKGHYIKLVLDEIFGENNFVNEVVWSYRSGGASRKESLPRKHDNILVYRKTDIAEVNAQTERQYLEKKFIDTKTDDQGRFYADTILRDVFEGLINVVKNEKSIKVYNTRPVLNVSVERIGYPTQKPEGLLDLLITIFSNKGDLVMDCFCGSGTTLSVAEKLERRWIGCDIGKLALYTTQKRLLEINESRDLDDPKINYGKAAKSFGVVTSGLYDLGKVFSLKKDEYIEFVKRLFEVEDTKSKTVGGVTVDGKRREFYVKIFPYWEVTNASVDEKYLKELHKNLGSKIDGRLYIIAPANNVNFISDYHQIDDIRYYFLKVPYQIIKELHKVQFKKLKQPQSKSQVNDLDEAIGFHFIRQPEVKSEIRVAKNNVTIKIKKFESAYTMDEAGEKLMNFESLAMILVDLKHNGDQFIMSKYFFAQDLLNGTTDDNNKTDEEIRAELQKRKDISVEFERKECGKEIVVVYVDIYGNEFREVFKVK
jgi:site-specific DNA-methyltransferase (adenine-specific)/adenine-specific DNA-methyltransferase